MGVHALKFCRNENDLAAEPYCECDYSRVVVRGPKIDPGFGCKCGEAECDKLEWTWDGEVSTANRNCVIFDNNIGIFHPIYSQGTAVLVGNKRLEPNKVHYWEMKILTPLVGTDLMFGVGTSKLDIFSHQYKFSSFLGLDANSWGYSYKGKIQHNKESKFYGKSFSYGTIISVLLDLYRGTISFYVNRIRMGIAYTNIPVTEDVHLYPMVCSTTANSAVKLMNSCSCSGNLQFSCLKLISQKDSLKSELDKLPGLKTLLNDFWFLMMKDQFKFTENVNKITLDEALHLCEHNKQLIVEIWPELEINCGIVGYSSARPTREKNPPPSNTDEETPIEPQPRRRKL